MKIFENEEVWFATGSQHLYGPDTLKQVRNNSIEVVNGLNDSEIIPVKLVFKDVLTTPSAIQNFFLEANNANNCVGVVVWMHTFSPAKMWINGLKVFQKPLVHLHTQYNRDIPWSTIDMDFMNLNQAAHGDREFGFICSRMGINRKVIVGYWKEKTVHEKLSIWIRAAVAWHDAQGAKIARFGDNMREVAVTEGDKVEAQIKFGYSVNGYSVGDLSEVINSVSENEVDNLIAEYRNRYEFTSNAKSKTENLRDAARIEIGLENFLKEGNFKGFTTTFENLYGLRQLPGIAVQRLMSKGYGFGAEGDWKTAAFLRAVKIMAKGLRGGSSFMEDYTYHFNLQRQSVLGAHMLEICESIAEGKPKLDIQPLGIGGKADPARLVFDVAEGPALNATIVDMGNRFRIIVNEVDTIKAEESLPNLPVARALWIPRPNLEIAATTWIYAGGAHHTVYSNAITTAYIEDLAEIAGIECLIINNETELGRFKNELKWNSEFFE